MRSQEQEKVERELDGHAIYGFLLFMVVWLPVGMVLTILLVFILAIVCGVLGISVSGPGSHEAAYNLWMVVAGIIAVILRHLAYTDDVKTTLQLAHQMNHLHASRQQSYSNRNTPK